MKDINQVPQDEYWMHEALALAQRAEIQGEVPVGAVLVLDNKRLSEGWNQSITLSDPCAHAEILALSAGGKVLDNYRLLNTTLYVTLEPCIMCVGAMVHARIARLVFGAFDLKTGAAGSVLDLTQGKPLNHIINCRGGVLAQDCGSILKKFFRLRR